MQRWLDITLLKETLRSATYIDQSIKCSPCRKEVNLGTMYCTCGKITKSPKTDGAKAHIERETTKHR